MAEGRPSLLDFASKDAFGCDDYEPRGEILQEHIINTEDGIMTVVAKSQRLADRVLDGKSVGVALGDIKVKRREEQELKNLTLKEKHNWQLWKNAKGDLPPMQWQADQEDVENDDDQQGLGKRKSSIKNEGPTEQRRRVKKRSGDAEVTMLEIEALAEIYHLPAEMRSRVVEADVRYFRRTYAPLKPLLSAMTKIVHSRSETSHTAMDKMMEEELRVIEMHSTEKAIYLAEKQAKWIQDETAKMCHIVHENVSVLRGRLAALRGQHEDGEDDEDFDTSVSSTAASPASGRGDDVEDQVEQDETMEGEEIEARAVSGNAEPIYASLPPQEQAEEQQMTSDHGSNRSTEQTSVAVGQSEQLQESNYQEVEAMAEQSTARYDDLGAAAYHDEDAYEEEKGEQDVLIESEPRPEAVVVKKMKTFITGEDDEDPQYSGTEQSDMSENYHNQGGEYQAEEESRYGEEQEVDHTLVQEQTSPPIVPIVKAPLPSTPQESKHFPALQIRQLMGPPLGGPNSSYLDGQGRFSLTLPRHWQKRQEAAREINTSEASRISSSAPNPSQSTLNEGKEAVFATSSAKSFYDTLS